MIIRHLLIVAALIPCAVLQAEDAAPRWLWSTAHHVPTETTNQESGYFSLVEGRNGRLYIGRIAKYSENAYLVEFDPVTKKMAVVVDSQAAIGTSVKGFAAQSKIHTRNNVGESGKIYFGTKQGYPAENEKVTDYLGGHPMVYDPATGKTRVYDIPIKHQGIISIAPDESRSIAYLSTCSDSRPLDSSHFMILDLERGAYRDLMDCQHMYAFIVLDAKGRAYHPILGGDIARYDPASDKLDRLHQTIDGKAPSKESHLADPESHPINWEISPDRKTLYAVAMSGNQLYAYDLTAEGDTLPGKSLGKLLADTTATDCRAMCVAPNGTVWAGVVGTFADGKQRLHVVSHKPGSVGMSDHGPIAIRNPTYSGFSDAAGKTLPFHHGVEKLSDGTLVPLYTIMAICAAGDGTLYLTTLYPFTLHAISAADL